MLYVMPLYLFDTKLTWSKFRFTNGQYDIAFNAWQQRTAINITGAAFAANGVAIAANGVSIAATGEPIAAKGEAIVTYRCNRIKCPRLDCPPASKLSIRVIITP